MMTDKNNGKKGIGSKKEGEESILSLFLQFFQFGCFTFGGGWSIVAQMQDVYVEKKKLISNQELIDITSVARSIPGTMIGNIAMMFGHRMAGAPGGFACLFGMILPPLLILAVITFCYTAVANDPWVMAAMTGIRAAVVPIILIAALKMVRGAYKYPPCYLVTLLGVFLFSVVKVNPVFLVLGGIVCGLLICKAYERKGGHEE